MEDITGRSEKIKYGFTTGSCAAAAAKGAVHMLLTGEKIEKVSVMTPAGILFETCLEDVTMDGEDPAFASCGVRKRAGDDPDVTDGMLICAGAFFEQGPGHGDCKERITISGGDGIGRVTQPGLSVKVGEAAINPVPLSMIRNEVLAECEAYGFDGRVHVVISAPEGRERALKTFNSRLGIEGGISVIGTSGIVEPMSLSAIKETIRLELNQKRSLGYELVALTFGNYGRDYMKERYGYDLDMSVKISNFVGDSLDMAADLGFGFVLLTGHIGKMVKIAGGIMNTHSSYGDHRMELMAQAAEKAGARGEILKQILGCVSTDAALEILSRCGLLEETMKHLGEDIGYYLGKKAADRLRTEFIVYSNEWGELIKSKGADEWFTSWEQAAGQRI